VSAEIIPFPRTKNRPFIEKHALNAANMTVKGGNNYLRIQIDKQRETMERRGIAPDVIDREIAALEDAIRAELALYEPYQPGQPGGAA
jgi:hypothetical protein